MKLNGTLTENNTKPALSVVMAVFNSEKYVKEAIESILNQTFTDFEFIIINDGSSDLSEKIITSYTDHRIKYHVNLENKGCVYSLNKGISLAQGKYIARMDSDDISMPERFFKQFNFLQQNPDVYLLGSHIKLIREEGLKGNVLGVPTKHEEIKVDFLFGNPFAHPSVMFNRAKFVEHDLYYRQEFHYAEDYELWSRVLEHANTANLAEVLLEYRLYPTQVSGLHADAQRTVDFYVKNKLLNKFDLLSQNRDALHMIFREGFNLKQQDNFVQVLEALDELIDENKKKPYFDEEILKFKLAQRIDEIVVFYTTIKYPLLRIYRQHHLYRNSNLSMLSIFKCTLKQCLKN